MRRLAVLVGTISLLAFAGSALAVETGAPPRFPAVKGSWTHITINRKFGGAWHTVILDRGRITQAGPAKLTLLESDGTTVVVPLAPDAIVQPFGLRLTIANLHRGLAVDTMRIDDGPAVRVRIHGRAGRILKKAQLRPGASQ